ncbi:unnamed protein product [Effrenium voratum]|nr:unnamed protein product [Effrenium voratum]
MGLKIGALTWTGVAKTATSARARLCLLPLSSALMVRKARAPSGSEWVTSAQEYGNFLPEVQRVQRQHEPVLRSRPSEERLQLPAAHAGAGAGVHHAAVAPREYASPSPPPRAADASVAGQLAQLQYQVQHQQLQLDLLQRNLLQQQVFNRAWAPDLAPVARHYAYRYM